jgi:hypothetical protein
LRTVQVFFNTRENALAHVCFLWRVWGPNAVDWIFREWHAVIETRRRRTDARMFCCNGAPPASSRRGCGAFDQTPSTGGLCRGRGYGPGYAWIRLRSLSKTLCDLQLLRLVRQAQPPTGRKRPRALHTELQDPVSLCDACPVSCRCRPPGRDLRPPLTPCTRTEGKGRQQPAASTSHA